MAKFVNPQPKLTAAQRRDLTNQIRSFRSVEEFRAAMTGEMLAYLGCNERSSDKEVYLGMVEMCWCYNLALHPEMLKHYKDKYNHK